MLNTLPSISEIVAAMESPVSPSLETASQSAELSTDDMIKAIFEAVMAPPAVS